MPAATLPTASERLADAGSRIGDKGLARKMYRLSVVSDQRPEAATLPAPMRAAPFFSLTVACNKNGCGATFGESTFRHVEDQRGRWKKDEREGNYQMLTDAEAEMVKAKMGDWIVRWEQRWSQREDGSIAGGRARLIDARAMPVALDPASDQAAADYLKMELVSDKE